MTNMSYCRFQNTLADLSDCVEFIYDDTALAEASFAERKACAKLVALCKSIAEDTWEDRKLPPEADPDEE
mgnify:CR=1 FL=1